MTKANHHLFLRSGIWWTRFESCGRVERESTRCPKSEVATARTIRNERLARLAERREGVEIAGRPLTLGELLGVYLESESKPYDREKGGEQPGTKRSSESDHGAARHILGHLSPNLSALRVTRETLLDLAEKRERETPKPAPLTRRNTFAFFRKVFAWAVARPGRTGITRSSFDDLRKEDRKRLFPKGEKRAYIYSPEELRNLYEFLPSYEKPSSDSLFTPGCDCARLRP